MLTAGRSATARWWRAARSSRSSTRRRSRICGARPCSVVRSRGSTRPTKCRAGRCSRRTCASPACCMPRSCSPPPAMRASSSSTSAPRARCRVCAASCASPHFPVPRRAWPWSPKTPGARSGRCPRCSRAGRGPSRRHRRRPPPPTPRCPPHCGRPCAPAPTPMSSATSGPALLRRPAPRSAPNTKCRIWPTLRWSRSAAASATTAIAPPCTRACRSRMPSSKSPRQRWTSRPPRSNCARSASAAPSAGATKATSSRRRPSSPGSSPACSCSCSGAARTTCATTSTVPRRPRASRVAWTPRAGSSLSTRARLRSLPPPRSRCGCWAPRCCGPTRVRSRASLICPTVFPATRSSTPR